MATTTPNFGWAVPTSTDLVKDGAVAIETLGDSIDASLVDLKGGTTGQVLAKASGTDMDFSWVAQDDSNAIQNALLTTTGDTIYASAASTPARLGIGSTGQVLTVASGVPSWATPASAGLVGVAAIAASATLSVTAHTQHTLPLPAENFDTDGFHSTSSNTSRITIPSGKGGKYLVQAQLQPDSTCNYAYLIFMKNGSNSGMSAGTPGAFFDRVQGNGGNTFGLTGSTVLELAATDYIELGYQSDATRTMTYDCRFSAIFLGA
jgi:hypothetical protein